MKRPEGRMDFTRFPSHAFLHTPPPSRSQGRIDELRRAVEEEKHLVMSAEFTADAPGEEEGEGGDNKQDASRASTLAAQKQLNRARERWRKVLKTTFAALPSRPSPHALPFTFTGARHGAAGRRLACQLLVWAAAAASFALRRPADGERGGGGHRPEDAELWR